MNHISIIGRITKDIDLAKTNDGKSYARFTIAVNETKEIAYFFDCIAWEKKAEVLNQYCAKGHQIAIDGKLTNKPVEKDGKRITYHTIVVSDFTFIQPKDEPKFDQGPKNVVKDDDLPF